jgi:hypothetical protein
VIVSIGAFATLAFTQHHPPGKFRIREHLQDDSSCGGDMRLNDGVATAANYLSEESGSGFKCFPCRVLT